eukprot:TRINITY_DN4388_c0_g1_i6.p1 TRINITY_DN4388_c0_g1~~TRINITY_DN4388_c0_g1_i6.p1  ORF type:complete len:201 (+),score=39.31 TRINITY_DN4388_c0_g1_i6:80-604(+)
MLRLLQQCCACGTTDRPDGPPSGAALSDEPSAADCGTNDDELTYSAPVLVSGYTPSDPSGAQPSGASSPDGAGTSAPSASTIRGRPEETESEMSDLGLLTQLFPVTPRAPASGSVGDQCASAGGSVAGVTVESPRANPGAAERTVAHSRSSSVLNTTRVVNSWSARGRHQQYSS